MSGDIRRVLLIGSGPIVIGQACEFDYSGTQACKALMKEGLEVILVNSNPATIMTDPEIATRVYVEPLNVQFVEKIIAKERPDSLIPTLGGQTALNLALQLHDQGVLQKYGVRLLGADPKVIRAAEDREIFRNLLDEVGARYPQSELIRTFEDGLKAAGRLHYPLILRPNYTLGGGGGGIAYSAEDYRKMLAQALRESPTSEVLVEASILGWREFELEVMRDRKGTFVVVCSIENFDPCGVHTGDSITVAPQQTLSDGEYQAMRDEACRILNKVGVETGGANIQFAVHPQTGERVVIEMNPRVSRSSALASKATGFPIAKIAALLAIGHTLEEIKNDITRVTPACFEPALDYIVTKIPRFAFEKFPGAKDLLTTQMKSVGEVMAIGRTLQESLMKALLSLEGSPEGIPDLILDQEKISFPNSQRIFHLFQAFRNGCTVHELAEVTQIHPYFLEQVQSLVQFEETFAAVPELAEPLLRSAKQKGFSDARLARLRGLASDEVTKLRRQMNLRPGYLLVDTCAGEFASETPYYYSTYWSAPAPEASSHWSAPAPEASSASPSLVCVIGSGPNRIGQGIEFDYSCVRGVQGFQRQGFRVAMINSNPETVSTDYDIANLLFFEPLTFEHLAEVMHFTRPVGFVAQLGGQTPINLAADLVNEGYQLLGSSLETIEMAEDRGEFSRICHELEVRVPQSAMAATLGDALREAHRIGYPVICRPSYVLGGRRMEIIENKTEMESYFERHGEFFSPARPCLIDQFLESALEVDVDLVRGPDWSVIGGVVEHIEAAGVHSGDSMGVIPPQRLRDETCERIEKLSLKLADRLDVLGHLNLQIAVKNDVVYLLEANPRSSRSVPFIVKATGQPLVDLGVAASLRVPRSKIQLPAQSWRQSSGVAVKGVVFPFRKFSEADSILGPEMKSTGESMGRGTGYAEALMKALISSQISLPQSGEVFFSLREKDKPAMLGLAKELAQLGFSISATTGTARYFVEHGLAVHSLKKVHEGRPHCVDRIRSGQVSFVINTTRGKKSIESSFDIRRACIDLAIPCLTETDLAEAFVLALKAARRESFDVTPLSLPHTI
ncbi:MAG: carbamoyl phosphate synthase large subunit [Bdellovibrio sp.]|nr:MAG: carbamoyl phosphate synthase large subunit [Bdellovibrio sp.]